MDLIPTKAVGIFEDEQSMSTSFLCVVDGVAMGLGGFTSYNAILFVN